MLIAAFRQCFENFPDLRLVGTWVCILFVLASPAAAQEADCNAPEKPMLDINLLFGRDVHGIHGVTEESWNDFMEKEIIAKRFKGFNVLDGVGYCGEPTQLGQIIATLVIMLVFSPYLHSEHSEKSWEKRLYFEPSSSEG